MRWRESMPGVLATGATLLALLVGAAGARAQPTGPAEPKEAEGPPIYVPGEGTEWFRHLVHAAGMRPHKSLQEALDDPQNTLIVMLGNFTRMEAAAIDLRGSRWTEGFLRDGGAILVATDRAFNDLGMAVEITGNMVEAADRTKAYRGSEKCPIVEPILGDRFEVLNRASPHHIFLHTTPAPPIATNNPSAVRLLRRPRDDVRVARTQLARYREPARFADGQQFNRDRDLFAVGGTNSPGRFLVLADHSVFINRMMLQKKLDNGNAEFAKDCLAWLRDGQDTPRTRCLFVEDTTIQGRFDLPVPPKPEPPLDVVVDTILNHGNDIVRELEDKDFANTLLKEQFGLAAIARFILVTLTVLLILYGLFKLWGARTGPDPGAVLIARSGVF